MPNSATATIPIETIIELFSHWLDEAKNHSAITDHNALNLATATKDGKPSNRTVLLKEFDQSSFVFYTNLKSKKSSQLIENPYASMCFFWDPLHRQVRISGKVAQVSDQRADAYFNSRDYRSRIGAQISKQSQKVESYEKLQIKFAKEVAKYSIQSKIKRPDHWSGYQLIPDYFEFWQAGEFRIHKREVYQKQSDGEFTKHYLYP